MTRVHGVLPIDVVDRLQEVGEVRDNVGHGALAARVDLFVLARLHEARGVGIVVGIAGPRHRAEQAGFGQPFTVALGLHIA